MYHRWFLLLLLGLMLSCSRNGEEEETSCLRFESSDKNLERVFSWATEQAQAFRGDSADPVGPWYEAALPGREAFCMRDVAHMCIGAEILGLHAENKNMLLKFAGNISESKDWCTYWEINRYNMPAPEDYRNDREFWYNLPANFDIVNAAFRLFKFTGDSSLLRHPAMENFIEKSMNEYVEHWDLGPGHIMGRKRFMHLPENYNPKDPFHVCRGLPSYVESVPNLRLGADLIALEYGGFLAAAEIALLNKDFQLARHYLAQAMDLKVILNTAWWDEQNSRFNTFLFSDDSFRHGEGEAFLLRYSITDPGAKTMKTIRSLLQKSPEMNIETRSYLPMILFKHGHDKMGYQEILKLSNPKTPRRDYPEVSFSVIEGVVCGLMGIAADARKNEITTWSHLSDSTEAMIRNLHVMGKRISVFHNGKGFTKIENQGSSSFLWKVCFTGEHPEIYADHELLKSEIVKNVPNTCSHVYLIVEPGETIEAEPRNN